MRGRVASDGREAMLPLTVIGSSGILAEVEATVDTGSTGSLCLPPDVVRYLSVPFIGRGVAVLADGSTVETSYVLVYALDRRGPEKRERAREVLRRVGGAGTAALLAQVLSESRSGAPARSTRQSWNEGGDQWKSARSGFR